MRHRYFKFKNIKIGGYGDYILTSVTNLESGSCTKRKIEYIDTDGAEYADIYYNERIFEISGFIKAYSSEKMVRLKRELISACGLKEKLRIEYYNRERIYSAECYFDKLPTFEKRQQWHLPFKLYLTIPGFYWQSAEEHTVKLFRYVDNIRETFTLPCIFTSLIKSVNISNNGDVPAYPEFIINCEKPVTGSFIKITNSTAEKTIKIDYEMSAGEVVTIDTFNQTAKSNINGNITKHITIDSEFSPMNVGGNHFECESAGNIITLKFRENYLGV